MLAPSIASRPTFVRQRTDPVFAFRATSSPVPVPSYTTLSAKAGCARELPACASYQRSWTPPWLADVGLSRQDRTNTPKQSDARCPVLRQLAKQYEQRPADCRRHLLLPVVRQRRNHRRGAGALIRIISRGLLQCIRSP